MQVTFYIPVTEQELRQDFADACEYLNRSYSKELVTHMKSIVEMHKNYLKDDAKQKQINKQR